MRSRRGDGYGDLERDYAWSAGRCDGLDDLILRGEA
jgi:hypothetical protein